MSEIRKKNKFHNEDKNYLLVITYHFLETP